MSSKEQKRSIAATQGASLFCRSATLTIAALASLPALAEQSAPAVRVVKDPATGEMRAPSPQEAAALDGAAATKSSAALRRGLITGKMNPQAVQHANGTVEQELDESSLSYSVAKRGADGAVETYCVTGADAATSLMKATAPVGKSSQTAKEHRHDVK